MRKSALATPSLVLFLCLFTSQAAMLVLSPILVDVAREFGVSTAAAGQLRSISGATGGVIAAIVACYKGMNAAGGPKGVGDAVNESVVITFMLLFVANFVMSAIYFQLVPPKTG